MSGLERWFGLRQRAATPATELRAGAATFLTMAYILFVNPQILSQAGMPPRDVAVATAVAAGLACICMGLFANYPFALAPGMGLNAYFTFGVVGAMGVPWQTALGAVFVEGVLFLLLAVVGGRTALMNAIPTPIKVATSTGIGLFLAIIGLSNAGLVVDHPATLVALGDLGQPAALGALAGIAIIGALLARGVPGAILIGIALLTLASWALGLAAPPESFASWPSLPRETLFALDLSGALSLELLPVVLAFLFVDVFDTAGTLIGVGRLGGFTDAAGELPRADRAFAADAVGTVAGALLGTSTVTTYIESSTGIQEGGRTGLAACTTGALFLCALAVAPTLAAVPALATAPALVVVGALMMQAAREVDWSQPADAVPAFLTAAAMPFTFSIANGIVLGILSYTAIRLLTGRFREVHPLLYALAAALVAYRLWA